MKKESNIKLKQYLNNALFKGTGMNDRFNPAPNLSDKEYWSTYNKYFK